ncbi:hypothetical protein T07_5097 [Trichinella nelsoni]|uniref:Uncharacterized protein n=1 Tax=Trichinella nelsoni TaxID=6336 RepID=A0A0V0SJJ5_9BILA|nr:hypothetical protein T07_5097 [Trichinella nelsoni]
MGWKYKIHLPERCSDCDFVCFVWKRADAVCCCGCLARFRGETLAKFEALEVAGRPDGLTIFTAFASAAELEMLHWKGRDFVDLGCQLRLSGPTLEPPDWSIKSKMAPDRF